MGREPTSWLSVLMYDRKGHTDCATRKMHFRNWFVELRYSGTKAVLEDYSEDTPE